MSLLPYDYLHLVNCPEVVTISDDYCIYITQPLVRILRTDEKSIETPPRITTRTPQEEDLISGTMTPPSSGLRGATRQYVVAKFLSNRR